MQSHATNSFVTNGARSAENWQSANFQAGNQQNSCNNQIPSYNIQQSARQTGQTGNPQNHQSNYHSNFQPNYHPNYHHHLRTKIEKWQIFFSGEMGPKALSVTEFIRQVTILANANRVTQEELLQQAYLFFTGEARKWYFTYWEKFISWEHLVYYLTMNFENPNKDKAIEDEMRERKQKSNERFSTYLADMERLSQSLTRPMEPQRKLKLIFDNTKISYRRRLALFPITSINELANYCYHFDAFQPSLFSNTTSKINTQGIHQLDAEDLEKLVLEDEDDEEINAINTKTFNKNNRIKKDSKTTNQPTSQTNQKPQTEEKITLVSCWNCGSSGHFAKSCTQPKKIYCYACGEPNVSKKDCPKQHFQESQQKNEK